MLNMERQRQFRKQARPVALALAATLGAGGNALAFNIDVDNEDIEMRLDTTVRYNAGVRVKNRNNLIGNNIASDEGTYLFDKGDLVTNRLDLFSEFDFAWKKQLGFRVSGAAWGDGAYGTASGANPKFAQAGISSYTNQQFSPYIQQYYRGPSGEILDAFVFANFDVAETPVKVRAGRHTVFWGESLFLGTDDQPVAAAIHPERNERPVRHQQVGVGKERDIALRAVPAAFALAACVTGEIRGGHAEGIGFVLVHAGVSQAEPAVGGQHRAALA